MIRRLFPIAVLAVVALAIAGCSKSPPPIVPVEGRVTLNGKPLPNAEVRFYPMIAFGGEYIAIGETDDDGRFKLACPAGAGACACECRVTVTEAPLPDGFRGMSADAQAKAAKYQNSMKNRPIPPQYANLALSPLKIDVSADRKDYDFALTR